jgi:hypothetical protein
MTRHRTLHLATWFLARLVPESEREPLVGDLMEEYALRTNATSSSVALRWYLRQVYASAPSLLWARFRSVPWFSTIGVTFLGYIAVGLADFAVKWVIPNWTADGTFAPNPIGQLVMFPLLGGIGYFAARFRRGASILLTLVMLMVTLWMLWGTNENLPTWFRISYFVLGPAAVLAGGALASRRKDWSTRR